VLVAGELPDPQPAPGEVRVKVEFSGINPTDTKLRAGWDGAMEMPFPRIVPHQDGAGRDRRGRGRSAEDESGERVWIYEAQRGRAFGTAAEYVAIPAEHAVPLPESASFETGACLGIAGMTAHRCLFQDGGIQDRRCWLRRRGAVGEGRSSSQNGAGRACRDVSRAEQEKVARQAGADLVVNRKSGDPRRRSRRSRAAPGVDRVVRGRIRSEPGSQPRRPETQRRDLHLFLGPPDSAPRIPLRR